MERHTQFASRRNEPVAARINRTVSRQRTDNHTVAAQTRTSLDVALHDIEFGIAVQKITGTRPDEYVDGQTHTVARFSNNAIRRRNASLGQASAQFDTIGPAFVRSLRGRERAGGNLQCDLHGHQVNVVS
jgi:hypothetical protein